MARSDAAEPWVSIIMGSRSDLPIMGEAGAVLEEFSVPHEIRVVSAHRTPRWMVEFASAAEARGIEVIIAGAGCAAHLPGMVASLSLVPVLGVPIAATELRGIDALLSIAQMPRGVPVGTLAIGAAGAANAGLLAVQMLAARRPALREKLRAWRSLREEKVIAEATVR